MTPVPCPQTAGSFVASGVYRYIRILRTYIAPSAHISEVMQVRTELVTELVHAFHESFIPRVSTLRHIKALLVIETTRHDHITGLMVARCQALLAQPAPAGAAHSRYHPQYLAGQHRPSAEVADCYKPGSRPGLHLRHVPARLARPL